MADLRSEYDIGEDVWKNAITEGVELSSIVIPGQPLKITGINSEGTPKMGAITAITDKIRALALFAGKVGDHAKVATKIRTKLTFGAALTAGDEIEFKVDGTVIEAAGVNPRKGYAIDTGAADDEGFIQFDGGNLSV